MLKILIINLDSNNKFNFLKKNYSAINDWRNSPFWQTRLPRKHNHHVSPRMAIYKSPGFKVHESMDIPVAPEEEIFQAYT